MFGFRWIKDTETFLIIAAAKNIAKGATNAVEAFWHFFFDLFCFVLMWSCTTIHISGLNKLEEMLGNIYTRN